ncbi:MAG: transposase [Spirochaetes bacterium]|nr:transposase [Spirochaetota bacterium]
MASIPQKALFGWDQIEALGDLKRLQLVLESLPDEVLMRTLEQERHRGRNEYPIRPMWNALVSGVVFQHPTVEALLRELRRNAQLRQVCGFELVKGLKAVPNSWAFSRFLARVMAHGDLMQTMFDTLVERLAELLPGYGVRLAVDGKALPSYARGKAEVAAGKDRADRRRDTDGEWGIHEYRGTHEDGTPWQKVKKWFGYTLHLVVDSRYELPVGFSLTRANGSEVVEAHGLMERLEERHPQLVERCQEVAADRAYDDTKLIRKLWDEWKALPIIDIRNCWQDGETTNVVLGLENVIYDYRGTVSCVCPNSGTQPQMAYGGFERDRMTVKYRCPARHYGSSCASLKCCPVGTAVRIALDEDRRVFTPLPRSSLKWQRCYAKRTSVERVNSRLDTSFGFEQHTIRGLTKMHTRCCLALAVMLAMAVGRIKAQQAEAMRRLVKAAA